MGFDQKGAPVFCVSAGQGGQWHVSEQGFEKPLATFQSRDEAEEYARDLARTKEGSTVRMPEDIADGQSQDQGGQAQAQGGRSQQQSFGNRI
jgi:hypothetical protein